jgi:hypothetical protein
MIDLNRLSQYKYAAIDNSISSRLFLKWYWDKCAQVFFKIAPNMAPNAITFVVNFMLTSGTFVGLVQCDYTFVVFVGPAGSGTKLDIL